MHPPGPVGAGRRRWLGLTRVNLAQNVSRDGDVRRGDEHVTRSGRKELRLVVGVGNLDEVVAHEAYVALRRASSRPGEPRSGPWSQGQDQ